MLKNSSPPQVQDNLHIPGYIRDGLASFQEPRNIIIIISFSPASISSLAHDTKMAAIWARFSNAPPIPFVGPYINWYYASDNTRPSFDAQVPQPYIRDTSGFRIYASLVYICPHTLDVQTDYTFPGVAALVALNKLPGPNWHGITVCLWGERQPTDPSHPTSREILAFTTSAKILPKHGADDPYAESRANGPYYFLLEKLTVSNSESRDDTDSPFCCPLDNLNVSYSESTTYRMWIEVSVKQYRKEGEDEPSVPPKELWPNETIPLEINTAYKQGYTAGFLHVADPRHVQGEIGLKDVKTETKFSKFPFQ